MEKTPFLPILPLQHVLPFLLLLVITLSRANEVDTLTTTNCTDADIVLGEEDVRVTANVSMTEGKSHLYKTVYMIPEEGFTGMSVEAVKDSVLGQERVAAWFSHDNLSIPVNTSTWRELYVHVQPSGDNIKFTVAQGDSKRVCVIRDTSGNLLSLDVVSYGPSRWRVSPRIACPYLKRNSSERSPSDPPKCTEPPPKYTEPPPKCTESPSIPRTTPLQSPTSPATMVDVVVVDVVVVAVVVVAVVVVVVFVVVLHRKKRRPSKNAAQQRPHLAEPNHQLETTAIENSLYEPFEAYRDGAATGALEETTHVSENSLYESFEAYRDGAATGAPEGTTHVSENSLYESFEAYRDGVATGALEETTEVRESCIYSF